MNRKSTPSHEPTESEIQHAAYLLWIEEGKPAGRDLEHWLSAKELLRHRHGKSGHSHRGAHHDATPSHRPANSISN